MDNQPDQNLSATQTAKTPTGLILFLSFLTLALLGATAYLYLQNQQLSQQITVIQKTPTPTSIITTPTPTQAQIQERRFKISYPDTWKEIKQFTPQSSLTEHLEMLVTSSNREITNLFDLYPDPFIEVFIKPYSSPADFDSWVSEFGSFLGAVKNNTTKFGVETTVIKGNPVMSITPGSWKVTVYLFVSPDKSNMFAIVLADKEIDGRANELNQILSTFKFVDTTSGAYQCPANGWVGCMPILSEEGKKACSPEAMTWYKANCPGFKGAAL